MTENEKKVANFITKKLPDWVTQPFDPSFLRPKETDSKSKKWMKRIGGVAVTALWVTALVTHPLPTIAVIAGASCVRALPNLAKREAYSMLLQQEMRGQSKSTTKEKDLSLSRPKSSFWSKFKGMPLSGGDYGYLLAEATANSPSLQKPIDPELKRQLQGIGDRPKAPSSNLSKIERNAWGIDKSPDR